MDPTALISQGLFSSTNTSSFSLTEIWPFPLSNNGGCLGDHFEQNLNGFGNRSGFIEESTVTTDQSVRKKRDSVKPASEDEFSKLVSTSSDKEPKNCDPKRMKSSGSGEENGDSKSELEASSGEGNKPAEQSKKSEPPKQDFIHVRARRGQATDSHSLAERARREKISERMKILQDLVPGCNKVIGKALVLDEIINYIQSLQRQVEFLSMKLEAVNSGPSPSIEGFPLKDFGAQQPFETTGVVFGTQATREYDQGRSTSEWLHMQVGGGGGGGGCGFERTA